jgi:hypothetical protein
MCAGCRPPAVRPGSQPAGQPAGRPAGRGAGQAAAWRHPGSKNMVLLHRARWEAALRSSAGAMERGKLPSFQRAPWDVKCSPLAIIAMQKLFSPGPCGPVLPPGGGSIVPGSFGAPVACCDVANSLSPGKCALLAWARLGALSAARTGRMREILTLPETCPFLPA